MLEFGEFKENVKNWATERNIYSESSYQAQISKAFEEIAEYLDAKTDEEISDAIGDIAVCLVNADNFEEFQPSNKPFKNVVVAILAGYPDIAIDELRKLAHHHDLSFRDCLSKAWNEIKDRKGLMVQGKFVKWESMTDEQKEVFEANQAQLLRY